MVYFLKINVAIALFYAFYRLFFYKDTFFAWRPDPDAAARNGLATTGGRRHRRRLLARGRPAGPALPRPAGRHRPPGTPLPHAEDRRHHRTPPAPRRRPLLVLPLDIRLPRRPHRRRAARDSDPRAHPCPPMALHRRADGRTGMHRLLVQPLCLAHEAGNTHQPGVHGR